MTHKLSGKVAIVGVGHTAFGKHPGRSTVSLNVEAIRKALADAGVEKNQVDGLFVKAPTSKFEMMIAQKLAEALRIDQRLRLIIENESGTPVPRLTPA